PAGALIEDGPSHRQRATRSPRGRWRHQAMYTVAHDEWKGVMHAVVTPFDADGAIDEHAFSANIVGFLDEGVHGVVLGGDNGEAWALSDEELIALTRLTRRIIDERGSRAKLVVGA